MQHQVDLQGFNIYLRNGGFGNFLKNKKPNSEPTCPRRQHSNTACGLLVERHWVGNGLRKQFEKWVCCASFPRIFFLAGEVLPLPRKTPSFPRVVAYGMSNQVARGNIFVGCILYGSKQWNSIWHNKTLTGV